ncbi:MAG: hypothetical protein K2Q26_08890 [Bdellovibrionales bacterium]|nr:hypothetical protein [Bdellovibrionales bacterium]
MGIELKPSLHISLAALSKILDSVKNLILSWALKLEEDGIVGGDVSFSADEIQKASRANYNITNIYGNIVESQVQQGTSQSTQRLRR